MKWKMWLRKSVAVVLAVCMAMALGLPALAVQPRAATHTVTFKVDKNIGSFAEGISPVKEVDGYYVYEKEMQDGAQLNFSDVPVVKNVGYLSPSSGSPDKWRDASGNGNSYKLEAAIGNVTQDYTFTYSATPDTSANLTVEYVNAQGTVVASEVKRSIKYNSSTVLKYTASDAVKAELEAAGYQLTEAVTQSYTLQYSKALTVTLNGQAAKTVVEGNTWKAVYQIPLEKANVTATFTLSKGDATFADGSQTVTITGAPGSTQQLTTAFTPTEWRAFKYWQYRPQAGALPEELEISEDGTFTMPQADTTYTGVFGYVEYTLTYQIVNKLGGSFYAVGQTPSTGDKYTKTFDVGYSTTATMLKSSTTIYPNKTGFTSTGTWYNEDGEQVEMTLEEITSNKTDRTYYCVVNPKFPLTAMQVRFCTEDGTQVKKSTVQNISKDGLDWNTSYYAPKGYRVADPADSRIVFTVDDKGSVYANGEKIIDAETTEYTSGVYTHTVYVKALSTADVATLTPSQDTVTYGGDVTLTATITVPDTVAQLAGQVEFRLGEQVLGTAPVTKTDNGFQAVLELKGLAWSPESYAITAVYVPTQEEFVVAGASAQAQLTVKAAPQTIQADDVEVKLDDENPAIVVENNNQLVGALTFEVISGQDLLTVDKATGAITLNTQGKTGTAVVRISAAGDQFHAAATLDVTITVTKADTEEPEPSQPVDPSEPPVKPSEPVKPSQPAQGDNDSKVPPTGDTAQMGVFLAVMLLSMSAMGVLVGVKRRKR